MAVIEVDNIKVASGDVVPPEPPAHEPAPPEPAAREPPAAAQRAPPEPSPLAAAHSAPDIPPPSPIPAAPAKKAAVLLRHSRLYDRKAAVQAKMQARLARPASWGPRASAGSSQAFSRCALSCFC